MTTTISDEQKKSAANVLESLTSFRSDFQQWVNLLSVRRRSVGWNWDLENNDPPGVPDLGLRERLASLGAELLPDLNGFTGEPAISQGALAEIIWLCERGRDNALAESPQEGKYYGPAFDVLEADLRSLSGSAKTTIASPATDPDEAPPALTENQSRVLQTMAHFDGSLLLSTKAIDDAMNAPERLSVETVRQCVAKLVEVDLAERPDGPRSGARLRNKGRRLAGKIAD